MVSSGHHHGVINAHDSSLSHEHPTQTVTCGLQPIARRERADSESGASIALVSLSAQSAEVPCFSDTLTQEP